ncbi:hypothetical protein HNP84_000547 [Thermocatellispora tengchongensis]|uniref:Uncharacterized protein n=1 Tax=Thermocatellispora tengchongensis TaxID=1073253 RepID=A0A840NVL8_9ACTN|nr:hypothetical protein [Thermocatellispora tengchongensis]MBB5130859.1 hypothetical protein [Thermocatellispora tengchongensis]
MHGNVRRAWRVAGGTLGVVTVAVISLTIWAEIQLERSRALHWLPNAEARVRATTETTSYSYAFTGKDLYLDLEGEVTVRIRQGETEELGVRRQMSWSLSKPVLSEWWKDGAKMGVSLTCPEAAEPAAPGLPAETCRVEYDLTVPPGTRVHTETVGGATACEVSRPQSCATPAATSQ